MLSEVPVGHGYVEATATVSTARGPVARLEAGLHPLAGLGLFGFAEARREEAMAGLGARWVF